MQEITRESLWVLLAAFIEKYDLTTRRVAKSIGCSDATITRLLFGQTLPSDEMMKQVLLMIELGFDKYSGLTEAQKEQLSQKIGAVGGGVLGFSGITAAVGALGVPGLSAAGITSGLAALGSVVGGGMIVGVSVAAAIPLAAGALGYAIIKGVKYFASERELDVADLNPLKPDIDLNGREMLKTVGAAAVAMAAAPLTSAETAEGQQAAASDQNPYGAPPGTGISMPPYYLSTPSVKNRNNYFRIITVIIIMGGLGMGFISTGHAAVCQRMAIPAYFYPGPLWDQATAGAPKVGVMIMNPNSGPGASQNPDYVAAVTRAKAAGIKVLGYVHTSYGTLSAATVKTEIDAYKAWYQVNDIFLDEVSADKALIPYYDELATYIRTTPGTLVMLNPGIVPDEGYMNVGDIIVVFEGSYNTYKTLKLPSWVFNYPGSKFAHLVHATSRTTAMKNAISLAKKRNAANVFVTNDVLPNPWDTLPGYWSQELQTLPATC